MATKIDDPNRIQDTYDQKLGRPDGSHDDLGVSADERAREVNDLENQFRAPSEDRQNENSIAASAQRIQDKEQSASHINNYTGTNKPTTLRGRAQALMKSKTFRRSAPFLGIGGGLAGVLAIFSFIVPGGFMVTSLMQMLTTFNDSSSTVMEQRFIKAFTYASGDSADPNCQSKRIKCRGMGMISNSALRKLDKKGVRACFDGNCSEPQNKRTGWPDKNPSHYLFTADGVEKRVAIKDLNGFLLQRENRKFAAKIYGPGGAINFRTKAWAGNIMKKAFYNPLGLNRNGGSSGGDNKPGLSNTERAKQALTRKIDSIPGAQELRGRIADVKTRLTSKLNSVKRGGTIYYVAAAGCIAPKIPRFAAIGIASIQLVQVADAFLYSAGSPGARIQAAAVDGASAVDPADVEAASIPLTERVPHSETGKLGSATESPYLLAAAGLGGKIEPSTKFSPAFGFLQSPTVRNAAATEASTKEACDVVLHPTTMYAAQGVDATASVLASSTIVGGLIKVAAGFAVGYFVGQFLQAQLGNFVTESLTELAENDAIPAARGVELGDTIGIGAAAFFASGATARAIPPLTKSKLAEYDVIRAENERFYGEMARETLSPFDISTPYTALGSVVHNSGVSLLSSGYYAASPLQKLAIFTSTAFGSLMPASHANNTYSTDYCSSGDAYTASDSNGSSADDVTRTFAGTSCHGFTAAQNGMDTGTAIGLMIDEGWVDETKDMPDGATPAELIEAGVIIEDTPLSDYITQCANPASGEFIFSNENCVAINSSGEASGRHPRCDEAIAEDEEGPGCPDADSDSSLKNSGIKDPRSTEAISVFLVDYQVMQAFNDLDTEEVGITTNATSAPVDAELVNPSAECPGGTEDIGTIKTQYTGVRIPAGNDNPSIKLCRLSSIDGTGWNNETKTTDDSSGAVLNAAVAGIYQKLGSDYMDYAEANNLPVKKLYSNSSFRLVQPCSGEGCANPGESHHQLGAAIDFNLTDGSQEGSKTSCSGRQRSEDPVWKWLDENAPALNIKQYSEENWHWEYVPSGVNEANKCPV